MKAIERWMAARPMRQIKIWWHWKYIQPGPEQFTPPADRTIMWHVELHEHDPLVDHGQRLQAGSWSKTEHVFTGYDKDLQAAARKALILARKPRT